VIYCLFGEEKNSKAFTHYNSDKDYEKLIKVRIYLLINSESCCFRDEDISISTFFQNYLDTMIDVRVHLSSQDLETFLKCLNCIFWKHWTKRVSQFWKLSCHCFYACWIKLIRVKFECLSNYVYSLILLLPIRWFYNKLFIIKFYLRDPKELYLEISLDHPREASHLDSQF
jgi:hypothetical protein